MLDGKHDEDNNRTNVECLAKLQDRFELGCLKLARCCKVEDLVLSAFVSEDNTMVALEEDPSILTLRKEAKQLLKLTRCSAIYFMVICLVYLFQCVVCYSVLDLDIFIAYKANEAYAQELYDFVSYVMLANVIHALTLLSMAFFVLLATRKFKILNVRHYWQLGGLTILITLVYFVPFVAFVWRAWSDAQTSELGRDGFQRFFDVFVFFLFRTEMGIGGFVLEVLCHLQLYVLIFIMMWCASHVKSIAERIQELKDRNSGTYKGLELKGANERNAERKDPERVEAAASTESSAAMGDMTLAEDSDAMLEEPRTGELL